MINKIVESILAHPYELQMGAGKLSRRYSSRLGTQITRENILEAKLIAKGGIPKKEPNILLIDIETAPLRAYIWQKEVWGANVSSEKVISEWFMLTWSAKWLYDSEIFSMRLTGEEAKREDDSRLVKELWYLLNHTDILVSHNGIRFDSPNIHTRFLLNGLPPCKPYQQIDTLRVAQKQFGFTHNNLNGLAKLFNLPLKLETTFELWTKCLDGDEESLLNMEIYNRHDVELLEQVYLKLRPWMKGHPNLGLYLEVSNSVCPNCGSSDIQKVKDQFYFTSSGKYQIFKCENCNSNSRERFTVFDKNKRKNLLVSLQ